MTTQNERLEAVQFAAQDVSEIQGREDGDLNKANLVLVARIADTAKSIAPSDKEAKERLTNTVCGELGVDRGKKYIRLAGEFLQPEMFHLRDAEEHLAYMREHWIESLEDIVRHADEHTARGRARVEKRMIRKGQKLDEVEEFYALDDADAALAIVAKAFGHKPGNEPGVEVARAIKAIRDAAGQLTDSIAA